MLQGGLHRLDVGRTQQPGGEQLHNVRPALIGKGRLCGRHSAGDGDLVQLLGLADDRLVHVGRDHILRAGLHGLMHLIHAHHGPGAHTDLVPQRVLDRPDGRQGILRLLLTALVKGHLDTVDAALFQRLSQTHDLCAGDPAHNCNDLAFQNLLQYRLRHHSSFFPKFFD